MSGIRTIRKLKSWLEGNDDNVKIGWYSEKQRNIIWKSHQFDKKPHPCANIYLTPEGKEILITEVTEGLTPDSAWDDMKMVGPVVEWKKSIYNMHTRFPEKLEEMCPVKIFEKDTNNKYDVTFPSYEKWQKFLRLFGDKKNI